MGKEISFKIKREGGREIDGLQYGERERGMKGRERRKEENWSGASDEEREGMEEVIGVCKENV